jgi:hypothetical protein
VSRRDWGAGIGVYETDGVLGKNRGDCQRSCGRRRCIVTAK